MNNTMVAQIQKNALDEIRIAFSEYKGHKYLDIRVHTVFDGDPEPRPTKKGITIKPEQIGELLEALQEAERQARAAGLIKSKVQAA